MLTSSSQSICLAKAGCDSSLPMSSPSRLFRSRKSSVLFPLRIHFIVVIVGTILLSMSEASPRHTRRRHRARYLAIESDPLSVLGGKGSPKGGKGAEALFDVDTSERMDGSGDFFSLAPIAVEGRLSDPPGLSPALAFLTPTGSPSASFSDTPSLSPTKASSDAPSLRPSTFFSDTSIRLSLAPSSVQVLTGATAQPSSESPAQVAAPVTVDISIPTASPTPSNSTPTGNDETGGEDGSSITDGDGDAEDGSEWRNMTSDSTGKSFELRS